MPTLKVGIREGSGHVLSNNRLERPRSDQNVHSNFLSVPTEEFGKGVKNEYECAMFEDSQKTGLAGIKGSR